MKKCDLMGQYPNFRVGQDPNFRGGQNRNSRWGQNQVSRGGQNGSRGGQNSNFFRRFAPKKNDAPRREFCPPLEKILATPLVNSWQFSPVDGIGTRLQNYRALNNESS